MTIVNHLSAFFPREQAMARRNSPRMVLLAFATMSALVLAAMPLGAAPIVWDLTYEFSGGTPPEGTLTVRLSDIPEGVHLNIDATGSIGWEFVCDLLLNFNDDPTTLTFEDWGGPYTVDVNLGTDAFKADGDGLYDIDLDFGNSRRDRLSAGEEANFTITGDGVGDGVTAESFNVLSTPAGGYGPFLVAAHIQGIGPTGADSGWVTTRDENGEYPPVPEASTMILFGTGLAGLLGFARRKIPFLTGR